MSIPSSWPAPVQAKAAMFLSLLMYYRWHVGLREAADVHLARHHAGWDLDGAEQIEGTGVIAHWLASLYVLIEGWNELSIGDAEIDSRLASPHVQTLKRFRHAVFHFQANLQSEKFSAFLSGDPVKWSQALGDEFDRFFRPHYSEIDTPLLEDWLLK